MSRTTTASKQKPRSAGTPAPYQERLSALRTLMKRHGVEVYLVPSADEHLNEYLPRHTCRREALSGFTGSAGDVAVTPDAAHLFVDSRYHLQAAQEADPALFTLHRLGLEGELELHAWLSAEEAARGSLKVGLDPFLFSLEAWNRLKGALTRPDSALVPVEGNLVDAVWEDRPPPPNSKVYTLPLTLTGASAADKLARVREVMAQRQVGALVLTRLDETAWITNLRGADIACNPVFDAYLLVEPERAVLFTDNPLKPEAREALQGQLEVRPTSDLAESVRRLAQAGTRIWLDPTGTTEGLRRLAGDGAFTGAPNPVLGFKAVKNAAEIRAIREAHIRSGSAKSRAFAKLEALMAEGQPMTEAGFGELLGGEYAREEGYVELSFPTICGFAAHGAIVHYGTPDPGTRLTPGELLLVDSGVQIVGATTDDTRTVAVGTPTEKQRRYFTAVLRSHIRLAMQVFPEGTPGRMLDAVARSPMWNLGLDYLHGTGHGVGAFLNVHEGPQSLSSRGAEPLVPGMVVSNEPGYYETGWGGIRCENLYVVEEAPGQPAHPGGKRWLRLSPLTLVPFDLRLVDRAHMEAVESRWLDAYHRQVWETLSPRMQGADREWLRRACGI